MAKIQLYAESKTIKLTKQQANSLNVLKSYNVDVSRFIKRSVKPIGQLCCRWDVSWGMFVAMLEYKAKWNGVNILRIGRFEPSSKTCSECGSINKELTLKDREWTCPDCGSVLLRDFNASINIKNFALNNRLSVERRLKNHGTLPELSGALTHEAHPIGSAVGGSSLEMP